MNKVIPITKVRFLMFAISLIVIVIGFGGTFLQGGFNLGIDFVGGYNQQIQFAPVAFSIQYNGTGRVDASIQRGIFFISILESGRSEDHQFNLADYDTVGAVIDSIQSIEGLTVTDTLSYSNALATRLLNTDYEIVLDSGESFNINIALENEDEIFADKQKVEEALKDFGRVYVQVLGNRLDQKFGLKIHNEDARNVILAEEGPSVEPEPAANPEDSAAVATADEELLSQTEQDRIETKIRELLAASFERDAILFQKNDYIGSTFSQEIAEGAVWSLVLALLLILAYISFRFKFNYAVAALSALVHDVAVMIGIIGLLQLEVTTTTFAAILTIVGYSLNDTIVVFDRVRENFNLIRDADRATVINTSITQSLSRTIITSLTTLLAVVAIWWFGTGVIKDFAFNLIIGVIVGTYSSIFIASPIVLSWMTFQDRRKKDKQEQKIGKKTVTKAPAEKTINENRESAGGEEEKNPGANPAQRVQRRKKKKKKK